MSRRRAKTPRTRPETPGRPGFAARFALGCALVGLAASSAAAYVHYHLLFDPQYASFCDVSGTVNLTSTTGDSGSGISGVSYQYSPAGANSWTTTPAAWNTTALTDGAYDLVFCDGAKSEYADYLGAAMRLLRPSGVVAFDNALWHGRVPDSSARDAETVAIRELLRTVRDDDRLVPVLLAAGDGLLAAVVRA